MKQTTKIVVHYTHQGFKYDRVINAADLEDWKKRYPVRAKEITKIGTPYMRKK